jgi:hypothetical protein
MKAPPLRDEARCQGSDSSPTPVSVRQDGSEHSPNPDDARHEGSERSPISAEARHEGSYFSPIPLTARRHESDRSPVPIDARHEGSDCSPILRGTRHQGRDGSPTSELARRSPSDLAPTCPTGRRSTRQLAPTSPATRRSRIPARHHGCDRSPNIVSSSPSRARACRRRSEPWPKATDVLARAASRSPRPRGNLPRADRTSPASVDARQACPAMSFGTVTRTAVILLTPIGCFNGDDALVSARMARSAGSSVTPILRDTTQRLGASESAAPVISSMAVPGCIHSDRTARVANGSVSGAPGARRMPMPKGDVPVFLHIMRARNLWLTTSDPGVTATLLSGQISSRKVFANSTVTDAVPWPSWRFTPGAIRKPVCSSTARSGAPGETAIQI